MKLNNALKLIVLLFALPALFLPERIKPPHPRAFFVVPPGWWGAVAGLPGSEADQVGAGLCELVDDRVCFGGGEVGGGPARRDDVLHSTALAGIEQHAQPVLALVSVVELGDQVEAGCVGVGLYQLPLPDQLEGVAGGPLEDGNRPSARLVVQRGGRYCLQYRRRLMWLIWRIRCGLCCHLVSSSLHVLLFHWFVFLLFLLTLRWTEKSSPVFA